MQITMTLPHESEKTLVMDGVHVRNLRTKFTYPEDAIDRIFDNAAAILSHCPGVGNSPCEPSVGIMIGKVQSGKTSNFIGLAALAMDNGYPLIIVLGGTKKNLVDQNCGRISEYFDNSEDVKVMAIGGEHDNSSVLEEGFIRDLINNGDRVVLVVLKKSQRMDKVSDSSSSDVAIYPVVSSPSLDFAVQRVCSTPLITPVLSMENTSVPLNQGSFESTLPDFSFISVKETVGIVSPPCQLYFCVVFAYSSFWITGGILTGTLHLIMFPTQAAFHFSYWS